MPKRSICWGTLKQIAATAGRCADIEFTKGIIRIARRMNVTFLTASVSRSAGGLFTSVRRTAQSLREEGVGVHVVGLEDKFTADDLDDWQLPRPITVPVVGPRFLGYSPRLSNVIAGLPSDLLHTQGLWTYTSRAARSWAHTARRLHVVSPRGMLDPWALANSRWKKRLAGWLYENSHLRRAACLHALCESEAKSIRAYGLRNPICIIPNGVDMPQSTSADPAPWSAKIDPPRKVLLFLGRIHPKKGLENLVKAWSLIDWKHEAGNWALAIGGWDQGGHEEELRRQCRDLGMESRVHFLGPQFGKSKDACYAHCSASILPSFSEGLPMTVLEAWSYGKPVLMTPECNIPEGFAANAAVEIETTPTAIADGIRQLVSLSPCDRRTMGNHGQKLIADKFNWRAVAKKMRAVYSWLLSSGPLPECVVLD